MKISSPKTFLKVPPPLGGLPVKGRPKSPLLLALEDLEVGQFVEVHLVPGQKPSLQTIRSSLPRWGRHLGKTFSIRKQSDENQVYIYHVQPASQPSSAQPPRPKRSPQKPTLSQIETMADLLNLGMTSLRLQPPEDESEQPELEKNKESETVSRYLKAAAQGDRSAQFNLGVLYANGQGVTKDEKEAVKWYRKAADQGSTLAQCYLGLCYEFGAGVSKDEIEAVKWYRKAADQGHAEAQCCLGLCYANGQGVTKDEKEAVKWYQKAADQGHAEAQCYLGLCYANGQGVTKDEIEAVKWYRKAANQGHDEARHYLGLCYANGQGVTKDEEDDAEALIEQLRYAAAQGDDIARFHLEHIFGEWCDQRIE
jgi:TPR repeat protein